MNLQDASGSGVFWLFKGRRPAGIGEFTIETKPIFLHLSD